MNATTVLTNGRIYTVDANQSNATAIALRGGEILAVGGDDEMRGMLTSGGELVDLGGRCVTPGLIDAHVHFQGYAMGLRQIDLDGSPSLPATLERIRARAGESHQGEWLRGRGWQQEIWEGGAFPTAKDLDEAVADKPAYFPHRSGHASWANSKAMQIAGITANTPDPPGGAIQRDENGNPTGIFFETASELIRSHVPEPTPRQLAAAMRPAQTHCWQAGLVGLHDFDGPDCFSALQILRQNGELGLRMVKNIPAANIDHAVGLGLRSGMGDDWLRIGGIKIFADGALGPRTALMVEPYEGEPDNYGMAVVDKEGMMEIAKKASANGLSVTVHAIGDRANHDILDVYAEARKVEMKADPGLNSHQLPLRHRIEHVQLLHHTDLNRLGELGVIASMQPIHATSDMETADRHWGDRAQYGYVWRTMLDTGATLVFGSDAPVEPIEPMKGIYAAVTRRRSDGDYAPDGWYTDQKLTMAETIHAFTYAAAFTSGQENRAGSIAPGKLADLTIYDRDIFAVEAEELLETKIAGTMVNGQFKYRAF